MGRTADELAAAIAGRGDEALSRRPAPAAWAAKEVVRHLRDLQGSFLLRLPHVLAQGDAHSPVLG